MFVIVLKVPPLKCLIFSKAPSGSFMFIHMMCNEHKIISLLFIFILVDILEASNKTCKTKLEFEHNTFMSKK